MKKYFTIVLFAASCMVAAAQNDAQKAAAAAAADIAGAPKEEVKAPKPNYWKHSLMTNLNFIQNFFESWAKGGTNNYALTAYIDGNANYAKDNLSWNNRLQLDYGFIYADDKPIFQKNRDRILLESTAGYKATKTLNYTAKFTLLTQFSDGFTYPTPSVANPKPADWRNAALLKSGAFSPAIATLGLGMDWIPNNWLKVNFAPLTGGFTIVGDERLRQVYGMSLKKGHSDSEISKDADTGLLLNGGIFRPARFEFGAQLSAEAKLKINDNFDASTQLILFSNYLNNPQNVRVNWDNRFMWKLAKYFALNLTTSLIYDDTVLIIDKKYPAGHRTLQFYEALQFGFTYVFATKK